MFVRTLTSTLQKKAETELNESSERILEDLQHIEDWLSRQPHLKVRKEDQWLLGFLRVCKFSLQETKHSIELFHTFKTVLSEYFTERDPFQPELQEYLSKGGLLWLPTSPTDPAAPKVIIIRPGCVNLNKISFTNSIKLILMILDILMREDDNFVIAGQNILVDCKDIPYSHAAQFTPTTIRKLITCLRYGYRLRVKKIHVVNLTPMLKAAYNIGKAFITDKISERIIFYNDDNLDVVLKSIPTSILPREYGGEGNTLQQLIAEIKVKVESYREWFLEDDIYRSDISKRPEKLITEMDLFGVDGSFRSLNID